MYSEHGFEALIRAVFLQGCQRFTVVSNHRFADFGQLALGFEDDGAVHIAQKIVARDADGAIKSRHLSG